MSQATDYTRTDHIRLWLILIVTALTLCLPSPVEAETKPHIVLVETMPVPAVRGHLEACRDRLVELGYGEPNTRITTIHAEGSRARAEGELRAILGESPPDVVMAFATLATQAAVSVLREGGIPIVFGVVSDPVGSGIVDSLTEPPGYPITGRIYTIPREVKLRHLLTMLGPDVPRPIRFGVIHSTYPSSLGDVRMLRRLAADNPEVEFVTASTEYRGVPEGADAMLDSVRVLVHALEPKIDYWWEPSGPLGELEAYHRVLLEESSRPIALGNTTASAKGGAMLTIMPDVTKGGRELADIAIQVLNGVPPQSLPIRPPDSFFIALNRDTILAEDLVIPSVLLRLGTVYPLE